ncbi:GNAT family N-acetyltransferase [Nonomuraea sp. NPDC047897]|uniref:GNAT family N-acetyltransferase n=1 Tax=Nonomuraea sp. NPDC047897 TaxID=3364346 RepID=UPI0037131F2D
MRSASMADRPEVAALIRARAQWMCERGMPGWEGWRDGADDLAVQAGDGLPVWVLVDSSSDAVIGVTSVYEQASPLLWPDEAEREQPSFFLATTVTDPAYVEHRPGCLIAWWALDRAARQGRMWVRRGTGPYDGLVRYYRDVQGWSVVRTVQHQGVTAYALERRAELQPHLPELGLALN